MGQSLELVQAVAPESRPQQRWRATHCSRLSSLTRMGLSGPRIERSCEEHWKGGKCKRACAGCRAQREWAGGDDDFEVIPVPSSPVECKMSSGAQTPREVSLACMAYCKMHKCMYYTLHVCVPPRCSQRYCACPCGPCSWAETAKFLASSRPRASQLTANSFLFTQLDWRTLEEE